MFLCGGFFDYLSPTYHGYLRVFLSTDYLFDRRTEETKVFSINVIILSHAKTQICAEVMFVKIFRTVSA